MKRLILVLSASTALFVAVPAFAIVPDQEFGLEGGTSLPSGDFGDAANAGFNLGGIYQANFANFGAGAEIKYHSWGASDDMKAALEQTNGPGTEIKFSNWQYGAFGVYKMPMPSAQPYVKFGIGAYSQSNKLTSPSGDTNTSDTSFGLSFGGGSDFTTPGSPVKFGVNAMYHRLKNSQEDFFTVSAKVMWPFKLTP